MKHSTVIFNAETAYLIACISLFSFGYPIGGLLCLALAILSSARERKERQAQERASLPSDELGQRMELPTIVSPTPEAASADPWTHDAKL